MRASGRFEEAVAWAEAIKESGWSPDDLAQIRFQLALAYVQLGNTVRGAEVLAEARAHFEATNDESMLAETMAAEASLAVLGQKHDAVEVAARALAACRDLNPIPRELEVKALGCLAAANLNAGRWEKTIDACEEAIERAGALFDMSRQAKLFSDAAIAHKELGQLDKAAHCARRSVALLEVLRDKVSLARSENNLGLIVMARGDMKAARKHLNRSLELCAETHLEVGRTHVLQSLCELCFSEGNFEEAREFGEQALAYAERLAERESAANAHVWLGRVAAAQGDERGSDAEFELAISQLARLESPEWLLRCHEIYADALEKRGELERAYRHLKIAVEYGDRRRS